MWRDEFVAKVREEDPFRLTKPTISTIEVIAIGEFTRVRLEEITIGKERVIVEVFIREI